MSIATAPSPYFCSQASRDAGEACFGTSVNADIWLLIEFPLPWGKNAVADSSMPPAVKAHLRSLSQQSRRIRVQLIKQESRTKWPLKLFIGFTDESGPKLYRAELNSFEDLLDLNADSLLQKQIGLENAEVDHPLFLVCTHGVHDKCCAKFGFATYKFMHGIAPQHVWQTSHTGGDRFASNVVSFPTGVYYGHVDDDSAVAIMNAETNGEIFLERYRGRTCYGKYAQVAEYFIRREGGIREAAALKRISVESNPEQTVWRSSFRSTAEDRSFTVKFEQRRSPRKALMTCAAAEPKSAVEYHLLEYLEESISLTIG